VCRGAQAMSSHEPNVGAVALVHYLNEIVDPTIKDFEEHPTSVRQDFLACVATYHTIDYLAYPNKRPATLKQESSYLTAAGNMGRSALGFIALGRSHWGRNA